MKPREKRSVVIELSAVMAERKMTLGTLSEKVGITECNLSRIKRGHIKMIRLDVLEAICAALACQPSDVLIYK